MTQKSGADTPGDPKSDPKNDPKSAAGSKATRTDAPPVGAGVSAQRGVRVQRQGRKQYLVATRRSAAVNPFAVSPQALSAVEQVLRSNPDIEVVGKVGPKAGVAALADGMPGAPHVIVARMEESKAQMLHQQGQGHLIVEEDQVLTMLDAPYMPSMVAPCLANAASVAVTFVVIGPDETPVEGAEVYLLGSLLPAMGVTNSSGEVTVSLIGDTPQTLRALYVKPTADFWSFYQAQPVVSTSAPNVVILKPLSESYPNFPQQQIVGWGQKAMRMDQLPPDRRGQGVKVAIIDSGAATSHEDLRNITRGYDALDNGQGPNNWMVDTIAHGSHCAGIVAGNESNGVGIRGFAPSAEIHACKIFPGGQISQLVDALEYCVEKQIDVVNLSLGTDQVSEVLEQQLVRLANLGIACIVAAGNSSGPVQYPASSPTVLAVAAIGHVSEFPPDSYHAQSVQAPVVDGFYSPKFTCFGPQIAVCAPGVAIISSVPPNDFAAWDGTSMAAPHVTGLAALVLAHHADFTGAFRTRNALRVQRLFQIIKASARQINVGDPQRTGFGLPDAPTALSLQLGAQTAQPAIAPQGILGQWPAQAPQGAFGGAVGPLVGNPMVGPQIGAAVGELGWYSPFAAAPLAMASFQQLQTLPWLALLMRQQGRGW
ncbi:MAG TPA: S8 family serine peptidase [Steroidobacter sp.]|uniref:S8 family peptidase n=1 Tax=Steroidobacter sp. TaxID=1978227 RepID=UPI002ED7A5E9